MAIKPETQFTASVHAHLPPCSVLHWEKMANPYRAGGADCWYSGRGANSRDLWIEWKFIRAVPKRTPLDLIAGYLSALQVEWLRDRHDEGRNVWVGIGHADGGFLLCDPCAWETPIDHKEFAALLLPRKVMAAQIAHFVAPEFS